MTVKRPSSPLAPRSLPSREEMYRAIVARDATYEGVFYTAVKTTGIFCRPTCTARKPLATNVEFFATAREALSAGYRACKRCRPLSNVEPEPDWLPALMAEAERAVTSRLHDFDLRRLGVDPSTARRYFLKHHGMTFHAYHRARRMGLALRAIRQGARPTEVQMKTGYQSRSGFDAAMKKILGTTDFGSHRSDHTCLLARWLDTPLGGMLAVASENGLCMLEFVDRRALETELAALRNRLGATIVPGDNPHLDRTANQLSEYFAGARRDFELKLDPTGSDFQKRIWSHLLKIPYAKVSSYAAIAKQAGTPKGSRAVGLANGRNQIAIVIPCHRVIRSDGALCGYGGGIERKQWLLDHEQKVAGTHQQLFH
ncbi:MAG: bifunctional transcriptional activator/DNA repair protein Ada [Pyrinomonadaceae bacterium]|nr:bifunctional transcriptional activator/DNA repair protein Ada [Phycisphaerales bacterium]